MNVVGIMWNYNEADLLPQILESAIQHVDSLLIADDESSDNSWDIIQGFTARHKDKVEFTRRKRIDGDKGQRQALLDEVRKRHRPEDIWVQVIESDIMILDTDVKDAIAKHAVDDMAVSWQTLNAVSREWDKVDTYPVWDRPLGEVMPYGSWMEFMLYTFRPLEKINYSSRPVPWPSGFSAYCKGKVKVDKRTDDAPLLAHFGNRGPTHFYEKYKHHGDFHRKYKEWDLRSVDSIKRTVPFFNGKWRGRIKLSREGWVQWRTDKRAARK